MITPFIVWMIYVCLFQLNSGKEIDNANDEETEYSEDMSYSSDYDEEGFFDTLNDD